KIKELNNDVPVIILSARSLKEDKILGFRLGVDDYITKPFEEEELLYRIRAVLNRMKHPLKNQLALVLNSEKPDAIINEVQTIFFHNYNLESFEKIENVFNLIISLFSGDLRGYKRCNTEYHDLKHTHDAFLATARLIDGMNVTSGVYPERPDKFGGLSDHHSFEIL
ncbi:MAG: response regulator transcription factor, partial [Bacteroidales bacterium]|nr:response regulator transcription factor [Bacteroidales bacterium]